MTAFVLIRRDMHLRSRDIMRPSCCKNIRPLKSEGAARPSIEGAGNAGCSWHPRPVCESSVHTVVTTGTPETPGIPCAMVLTAYAALSRATNSSCHPRRRIEGGARPGRARITSAGLTPATGARTTRFCRTRPAHRQGVSSGMCTSAQVPAKAEAAPFVCAPGKRSQAFLNGTAALRHLSRPTLPRPPHPVPTFVTMANAPLIGTGRQGM